MKTLNDLDPELRQRLAGIRLLLMDVDGVLTDGLIHLDDSGVETKLFSTRDGLALYWLRQYGLRTGIISGRQSRATLLRCQDLGIDEIHLGATHKIPVFEDIIRRTGIAAETIAYIGDDVIDLSLIQRAGVSAAPADAHPEVLARVDIVLDQPGGRGAVRHFLDLWLAATGHWETAIEDMLRGNY
ncbi:HAD hydrolase family protein [bacterium]|nr:HAD hydrolase family protein [bacterium]MBU1982917.1 HAD hydrolase family protein [bacterium]